MEQARTTVKAGPRAPGACSHRPGQLLPSLPGILLPLFSSGSLRQLGYCLPQHHRPRGQGAESGLMVFHLCLEHNVLPPSPRPGSQPPSLPSRGLHSQKPFHGAPCPAGNQALDRLLGEKEFQEVLSLPKNGPYSLHKLLCSRGVPGTMWGTFRSRHRDLSGYLCPPPTVLTLSRRFIFSWMGTEE